MSSLLSRSSTSSSSPACTEMLWLWSSLSEKGFRVISLALSTMLSGEHHLVSMSATGAAAQQVSKTRARMGRGSARVDHPSRVLVVCMSLRSTLHGQSLFLVVFLIIPSCCARISRCRVICLQTCTVLLPRFFSVISCYCFKAAPESLVQFNALCHSSQKKHPFHKQ